MYSYIDICTLIPVVHGCFSLVLRMESSDTSMMVKHSDTWLTTSSLLRMFSFLFLHFVDWCPWVLRNGLPMCLPVMVLNWGPPTSAVLRNTSSLFICFPEGFDLCNISVWHGVMVVWDSLHVLSLLLLLEENCRLELSYLH
jgi:hypothetical protein